MQNTETAAVSTPIEGTRVGRYRWRICALLLLATTINYIDRQVLGVLAPDLQRSFAWSEIEYGYIVTAFQAAYAIGLVCAGAIIDRLGTRIGYALAILVWSLAAMSHALASTVIGFAMARFALGLGESGNFPAAIKTVAEWFPRRERALRHRHLQLRFEHWRHHRAARRADHCSRLGLAGGVPRNRLAQRRVAGRLVAHISSP